MALSHTIANSVNNLSAIAFTYFAIYIPCCHRPLCPSFMASKIIDAIVAKWKLVGTLAHYGRPAIWVLYSS